MCTHALAPSPRPSTSFGLAGTANPRLEKELRLPLPEMTFGHNSLVIQHPLVTLSFDTLGALRAVPVGEGWEERCGGGVLVSMADAWKNRKVEDVAAKPVRPHDWTFSTCFNGATSASAEGAGPSSPVSSSCPLTHPSQHLLVVIWGQRAGVGRRKARLAVS